MRGSRNFCQFYLVLSLFYSLKSGSNGIMVLLLRKLYLYFTKDPEAVHYILGGGGSNFFQGWGVQTLISIKTNIRTCYFPGGGVRTPYPPLDPHMGNVIITGQYLSQSGF